MGIIKTSGSKRADELQNYDWKFTEEIRHFNKNRQLHERTSFER